MNKQDQDNDVSFAEIFNPSGCQAHQSKSNFNYKDARLMLYFQGTKIYIPDGFNKKTLLQLLRTLKQL